MSHWLFVLISISIIPTKRWVEHQDDPLQQKVALILNNLHLRLRLITARAQMFLLPSWFRCTEAKARPWKWSKLDNIIIITINITAMPYLSRLKYVRESPAEGFRWQWKEDMQTLHSVLCWCSRTSRRPVFFSLFWLTTLNPYEHNLTIQHSESGHQKQ